MKALLFVPLALALAGCGTTRIETTPEPIVVTHEVLVPVAVDCVPAELGAAPEYVDTDEALNSAEDGAVRFQLLIAGRTQRSGRLNELEPVVNGCSKAK